MTAPLCENVIRQLIDKCDPLRDSDNAGMMHILDVSQIVREGFASLSVEAVARAICTAEKVDPDAKGFACSQETRVRLDETYPLWQYWIPAAQAILALLRKD